MQKNKFVHEDIKAVCSSATKKLVACGLAMAINGGSIVNAQMRERDAAKLLEKALHVEESTAVGSGSNTANSQSRSSRQPRATGESTTTGTSRTTPKSMMRELSPEELKEVIAKGKGEYKIWLDWCKANNVRPVAEFLELDIRATNEGAALDFTISEDGGHFSVQTHPFESEVPLCELASEEVGEPMAEELNHTFSENVNNLEVNAQAQEQPNISSPAVASAQTPENNAQNNPGEIVTSNYSPEQFAKDAEKLMDLLWAKKEKARATLHSRFGYYEYDPNGAEEWDREKAFNSHLNHPRNFDTTSVSNAFQLRFKLDYLRKRIRDYNSRLDGARLFSGFRGESDRYLQVEGSLRPQNDEPPRYDMELAGEYLAWVTPEVERLESLARYLQQQLNVDKQEQIEFNNIVRWLTPGSADFLAYMEDAHNLRHNTPDHLLDGYWDFAREQDELREEVEQLRIVIDEQTEQSRRNQEEFDEMRQILQRTMDENIAFFSQPCVPPALTNRDIDMDSTVTITREDFERDIREYQIIARPEHNNQIDDYQTQNDNNTIPNNQIEEIVGIEELQEEQEHNNPEHNNQQQQQGLNILTLNQQQQILNIPPVNQPAPQQRTGIWRGTLNFIGNMLSSLNPFAN